MADTEKITINMSVVDLGQVDLLVEEGFYSSRTDFIRTAIRRQLEQHQESVRQTVTRKSMAIGVVSYSRQDFEQHRAKGIRLTIAVVGMLHIADDISPELAEDVIESIQVMGVFHATPQVKAVLASRTRSSGRKGKNDD